MAVDLARVREVRERLVAVAEYMSDYLICPQREGYLHLPRGAEDAIVAADREIQQALDWLSRIDRQAVGGERHLHESPAPNDLCARRAREAFGLPESGAKNDRPQAQNGGRDA